MEVVYDLFLPAAVREMLYSVQFTISLGIDGIPLSCVGATDYTARLILLSIAPIFFLLLAVLIQAVRLLWQRHFVIIKLLRSVAPVTLRIAFLCYPIITNRSFEAFSCYEFADGSRWLITDVSIRSCAVSYEYESCRV